MVLPPRVATFLAGGLAKGLAIFAAVAIFVGSYTSVYFWGKAAQRTETAEEIALVASKHSEQVQKEAELNAREAAVAEREAAKTFGQVDSILGDIRNAVQAKGPNPQCDLSPDELLYFQQLVETTKGR